MRKKRKKEIQIRFKNWKNPRYKPLPTKFQSEST